MTLPSFIIVGAMKCGTTTLHEMLATHPQVFMTSHKELHYFDRRYDRGPAWYESQFTPSPSQIAVGESTPSYMWDVEARDRMVVDLPEIQVVVMLRDPVKRAYSHYWHSRERAREEALTFESALEMEPGRRHGRPAEWRQGSYLDRGRYIEQLRALESAYGRDRMKVILLEDLIGSTPDTLRDLLEFLHVDPAQAEAMSLVQANPSGGWQPSGKRTERQRARGRARRDALSQLPTDGKPPMDPATRDRLSDYFGQLNQELSAWLGRDLSHWT